MSEIQGQLEGDRAAAVAERDELRARATQSEEAAGVLRAQLQHVLGTLLEARREPPAPSGPLRRKLLLEASTADGWPRGALPDGGIT